MKIKAILAKIAKKEELTEAELTFLAQYEEPKPDTAELDRIKEERDNLQSQLDNRENEGKSELEKLQQQVKKLEGKVAAAEKDRDNAKAEKESLERSNAIRKLASEQKFENVDYLTFLIDRDKVDLNDADAVKNYMDGVKKSSPKFFSADVNTGGAGSGSDRNAGAATGKARIEELLKKDKLTFGEVAEIEKLQSEIDSAEQNTDKQ